MKLPEYLASINYCNPSDPQNTLFHYALDTELNMFQWLKTQPDQLEIFSQYIVAGAKFRGRWLQDALSVFFPTGIDSQSGEDHVLLVDIGAGRGQFLRDLRSGRPDLVGRMIAQDLPEVIARRDVVEGVENMAYDFFEPQPVKGASFTTYHLLSRLASPLSHPPSHNFPLRRIPLPLLPHPPRLAHQHLPPHPSKHHSRPLSKLPNRHHRCRLT